MATTTERQPRERYVHLSALHLLLGNLELEVGFEDEVADELAGRVAKLGEQLWPDLNDDHHFAPPTVDARVCALVAEMLAGLASNEARERCIERAVFFANQAGGALERNDG